MFLIQFRLAFDWASLPPGSVIVDVGGGIGSVPIQVAHNHPEIQFIVQDRPAVVADGRKVSYHPSVFYQQMDFKVTDVHSNSGGNSAITLE